MKKACPLPWPGSAITTNTPHPLRSKPRTPIAASTTSSSVSGARNSPQSLPTSAQPRRGDTKPRLPNSWHHPHSLASCASLMQATVRLVPCFRPHDSTTPRNTDDLILLHTKKFAPNNSLTGSEIILIEGDGILSRPDLHAEIPRGRPPVHHRGSRHVLRSRSNVWRKRPPAVFSQRHLGGLVRSHGLIDRGAIHRWMAGSRKLLPQIDYRSPLWIRRAHLFQHHVETLLHQEKSSPRKRVRICRKS